MKRVQVNEDKVKFVFFNHNKNSLEMKRSDFSYEVESQKVVFKNISGQLIGYANNNQLDDLSWSNFVKEVTNEE